MASEVTSKKQRASFWLTPEQMEFFRGESQAAGTNQSEFIDMLIQIWKGVQTGRVIMHQVGARCTYQDRLDQLQTKRPASQ